MGLETNPYAEASTTAAEAVKSAPVRRVEHAENQLTRLIEQQSAKIPSNFFLTAALIAMATSFVLEVGGKRSLGRFFGMWPGPLLTMGVYNKLVKSLGAR